MGIYGSTSIISTLHFGFRVLYLCVYASGFWFWRFGFGSRVLRWREFAIAQNQHKYIFFASMTTVYSFFFVIGGALTGIDCRIAYRVSSVAIGHLYRIPYNSLLLLNPNTRCLRRYRNS